MSPKWTSRLRKQTRIGRAARAWSAVDRVRELDHDELHAASGRLTATSHLDYRYTGTDDEDTGTRPPLDANHLTLMSASSLDGVGDSRHTSAKPLERLVESADQCAGTMVTRWKPTMNALAVSFADRMPSSENL